MSGKKVSLTGEVHISATGVYTTVDALEALKCIGSMIIYGIMIRPNRSRVRGNRKGEKMSDSITKITTDELRKMGGQEGLVLQGCGGDLQEWLDGINGMLAEAGILLDGSRFERTSVFQHDGLTNLLFPFEGVKLNMGKLAMWRLQTHGQFGGTWLSDYVLNRLGGFTQAQPPRKPKMEMLDQDGNIFAILGRASMLLKETGMRDQIDEMFQRCEASGSYGKALGIIGEYVDMDLPEPSIEPQKSHKKKGKSAYER